LPPDAESVCEYACPTVPPGRELVVMATGGATIRERDVVSTDPFASFTWTENVGSPAADGVPVREPPELRLIPEGRDPDVTVHWNGGVPPDVASV
jgi:hypothetical protein